MAQNPCHFFPRQRYKLLQTSEGPGGTGDRRASWGRVTIIAPEAVVRYHEYAACVAGLDEHVRFVSIGEFVNSCTGGMLRDATDGCVHSLKAVRVPHCRDSYAVVLTAAHSGYRVVYSGDCRPSPRLVMEGSGCDLLIHEATFDDSRQQDALTKAHCTTSEAVDAGTKMGAAHLILTHFSQRYPKTSQSFRQTVAQTGACGEFAVAFDFLRVSLPSQLSCLSAVTDHIVAVLGEVGQTAEVIYNH